MKMKSSVETKCLMRRKAGEDMMKKKSSAKAMMKTKALQKLS
jgi:hypothetical protein